jgi:ABC-type uncharacterized transport system permease subunit
MKSLLRSGLSGFVVPVAAVGAALGVCAVFVAVAGVSPAHALQHLILGAFGTPYAVGTTLAKTVPLFLVGLSVAIAFRTTVFNIGMEGQIYLGALWATWIGISLGGSGLVDPVLCLLAGCVGGALWALIPALMKSIWGINEVIVTIMLNHVAINLAGYFTSGPLHDPTTLFPESLPVAATARLPAIWAHTPAHAGVLVAILAGILVWVLLWRTSLGFRLRAVGGNAQTARFSGMNVGRSIVTSMLFSGALSGLAGSIEVLGVHGRLIDGFSPEYGFLGIAVALLGGNHPIGISISALFFGMLLTGANAMQSGVGVPISMVKVVQGLTLLFVVASLGVGRILRQRKAGSAS